MTNFKSAVSSFSPGLLYYVLCEQRVLWETRTDFCTFWVVRFEIGRRLLLQLNADISSALCTPKLSTSFHRQWLKFPWRPTILRSSLHTQYSKLDCIVSYIFDPKMWVKNFYLKRCFHYWKRKKMIAAKRNNSVAFLNHLIDDAITQTPSSLNTSETLLLSFSKKLLGFGLALTILNFMVTVPKYSQMKVTYGWWDWNVSWKDQSLAQSLEVRVWLWSECSG